MTRTEVTKLAAKVAGLTLDPDGDGIRGWWYFDANGERFCVESDWNPLGSLDHAMMVVGLMNCSIVKHRDLFNLVVKTHTIMHRSHSVKQLAYWLTILALRANGHDIPDKLEDN